MIKLAQRKKDWLIEAQKLLDGMTSKEFEIFITKCSTELSVYKDNKIIGWWLQ